MKQYLRLFYSKFLVIDEKAIVSSNHLYILPLLNRLRSSYNSERETPRNERKTALGQKDCRARGKDGCHSCLPSNQTFGDHGYNHYIKHLVVCLCTVGGGGKPVNRRHSANHMILP